MVCTRGANDKSYRFLLMGAAGPKTRGQLLVLAVLVGVIHW